MRKLVILTGGACCGKTTMYKKIAERLEGAPGFVCASTDWSWKGDLNYRKECFEKWLAKYSKATALFLESYYCITPTFEVLYDHAYDINLTVVCLTQSPEQAMEKLKVRRLKSSNIFGRGLSEQPGNVKMATGEIHLRQLDRVASLYEHKLIVHQWDAWNNSDKLENIIVKRLGY